MAFPSVWRDFCSECRAEASLKLGHHTGLQPGEMGFFLRAHGTGAGLAVQQTRAPAQGEEGWGLLGGVLGFSPILRVEEILSLRL